MTKVILTPSVLAYGQAMAKVVDQVSAVYRRDTDMGEERSQPVRTGATPTRSSRRFASS